jgi:hypothetical protein
MAIKDESAFEELKPYLKMTVAPNGVTVGDLNFVVAQTQWSSALIPIAAAAAGTIPADVNVPLFQTPLGDPGQNYTTGLTLAQTSWQDGQGRLPANQVFIATSCGFQLFRRNTQSTTATATEIMIPQVSATHAIARKLSWQATIGDGITRNYGALIDFGGYGGSYTTINPTSINLAASNVTVGDPEGKGRKLRIPLVFPPNISVRIAVVGGESFVVDTLADAAQTSPLPGGSFLGVKQFLHGYLCTMPVG